MHYTGTIWRPPYEAESLLLEVTAGCTHHSCKFCTLYAGLPFSFRMTPIETIQADLTEAGEACLRWGGEGPRRVFLTGANPFVLKTEKLLELAARIHRALPAVETIGSFSRITDTQNKSDDDLSALRRAGYDGLTIGVETGDEQALSFMNKGYTAADILTQCGRLDQAGIGYSFFYLAGISGPGRGDAGARATVGLFNQLHPIRVGANMLTIYPDSALFREIQRGNWAEESETEKYQELGILVKGLTVPTLFQALGASNAVQLHGYLPRDRERLLETLDRIIALGEPALRRYRESVDHL